MGEAKLGAFRHERGILRRRGAADDGPGQFPKTNNGRRDVVRQARPTKRKKGETCRWYQGSPHCSLPKHNRSYVREDSTRRPCGLWVNLQQRRDVWRTVVKDHEIKLVAEGEQLGSNILHVGQRIPANSSVGRNKRNCLRQPRRGTVSSTKTLCLRQLSPSHASRHS